MNAIEVAALSKTYSGGVEAVRGIEDRKSTRLNSSHLGISYAVFCLKKKKNNNEKTRPPNKHNKNTPQHQRITHTPRVITYCKLTLTCRLQDAETRDTTTD